MNWDLSHIELIHKRRLEGIPWVEIQKELNKSLGIELTVDAVKKAYARHRDSLDDSSSTDELLSKVIKQRQTSKIAAIQARKESKVLLNFTLNAENLLSEIDKIIDKKKKSLKSLISLFTVKTKKPRASSSKRKMTVELLVSDIQYGKLTELFNCDVARERLREVTNATIEKIKTHQNTFNVECIKLALLGDIIESSTMHGMESAMSVECGNAEQIRTGIESLFLDLILPLSQLNIPIEVFGIPGNHDRVTVEKTMNYPGKNYMTWVIYHTLKMLTDAAGIKNINYVITEGSSILTSVYGHNILYEHGDNLQKIDEQGIASHVAKRSKQYNKIITYFRMGDKHKLIRYGEDEYVINGSICGGDSYSEIKGFSTRAVQLLLAYVERNDSKLPFYESFPIQLEHLKR